MKTLFTSLTTIALAVTAAQAHPGHVAPANGHSHGEVLAIAAFALLAVAALIWNARRS